MTTDAAFLNVEQSFTGRRWQARSYDERTATALAQRHGLPDVVARSLGARGVTLDGAESFLRPRLRDLLPDPLRFRDMTRAVERLLSAIERGERVAIFGDYDVDGGTSSALLTRFLRAIGAAEPRLYIPDRRLEGYGPNPIAMQTLAAEGVRLVICVDCGTAAHEALAAAKAANLDVIVLDHHAAAPDLPPAVAIVNPNRLDESDAVTRDYGHIAAVGVTFLFVAAVNRALREAGYYAARSLPEPDLLSLLDLVALGTICDVMPLTGLNRAFVVQGLKVMAARHNKGIAALAAVASTKGQLEMGTYAAGFVLGPRINAGGRVGQSDLGARLLATDDMALAAELSQRLHILNDERRAIEAEVLLEAEAVVAAFGDTDDPVIVVAGAGWHPGVIGIVASRLKEKFNRPSVVIATENGIGKGSGRSVGNADLGAAIIAARQSGLLLAGGGHRMAAGLTVEEDKIPVLRTFLNAHLGKQVTSDVTARGQNPPLIIDGLVAGAALTGDFLNSLESLAPFGVGNSEPRYAMADVRIMRATVLGDKHVQLLLRHGETRLRAIAFSAMDSDLGTSLLSLGNRPCHLAGYIRRDDWRGDGSVQMIVKDAANG